ncbi:hypothetical protein [Actinomadura sp. NBRC 104425]|nr:hypothetical protein [Actinomadura sp. NBRC 104425]
MTRVKAANPLAPDNGAGLPLRQSAGIITTSGADGRPLKVG